MSSFVHSQKVPKIYKATATIACLVQEKGASIKELVFSDKYRHFNTKALYALTVETIQHEKILDELIRDSKILVEGRFSPWLARVLITELLWGKKTLPDNNCKPIQTVLEFQPKFLATLRDGISKGTHSNEKRCNKALSKPRYVRVNTLALTVEAAVEAFCREGWHQGFPAAPGNYASYLDKLATIEEDEFVQDVHVREMFAFPPGTEFFEHEMYREGNLILQDKATSLAAFLLDPAPGSSVLDMCAAPGLKTTHLAAIMQNKGTLYAVEKDQKRYKTLCDFVARHGATCLTTIHADATMLTAAECEGVEYVLVDPSCSGSGMTARLVTKKDEGFDHARLAKLAAFQLILLERALTVFPAAKRVVYSTCAINPEENEQVVEKVLAIVNPRPAEPLWVLADDVLADTWPNRGSAEYECGPKCVYADPEKDLTTGFFVAVFERTEAGKGSGGQSGNPGGKNYMRRQRKKERSALGGKASAVPAAQNGKIETGLADEYCGDGVEGVSDVSAVKRKKKKKERVTDDIKIEAGSEVDMGGDGCAGKSGRKRKLKNESLEQEELDSTDEPKKEKKKRKLS